MDRGLIAILVAPLLAALTPPPEPPPVQDQAGNWSLPFVARGPSAGVPDPNRSYRICAGGPAWCAQLSREDESSPWILEVFEGSGPPRRITLSGQESEEVAFDLFPRLYREAGGAVLIGLQRIRRTAFSGGGAMAAHLLLIRVEPAGGPAAEVLDLPYAGRADIRACFTRQDHRRRRGHCQDSFWMGAHIEFDTTTNYGPPRFLLNASATTFPGRLSRLEDSTAAPRLRRSDLVVVTDPACSYRRILAFDPASGRYLPDSPLPDCSDYFDF